MTQCPHDANILCVKLLFMEWAHWKNFYKQQPLWLVKRYFGDKVDREICSSMYDDDTGHLSSPDRSLLRLARLLQPDAGVPRPLRPLRVPLRGRHRQQQQHQLRGVNI